MDTRTLELVVGLYEEPVIIDTSSDNDDEVGRIYTTGDDDFDDSDRIPFGEELVRRFNEYPQQAERIAKLEEALNGIVDEIKNYGFIGVEGVSEHHENHWSGSPAMQEAIALLQTLKA